MKPATLKRLRTLHRWAGLFFAPMIVLFALTGALQVLGADDWPLPEWLLTLYESFEDAHQDQRFRRGTALRSVAAWLTVAMGVALAVTTVVGVAIGFKMYPKKRVLMAVVVGLGVVVPVVLMLV